MSFLQVEVDTADLLAAQEQLERDTKPLMAKLADRLAGALRRQLDGGNFAALAPATLELRRRRGIAGDRPLHASGTMSDSLRPRHRKDFAAAGFRWPAGALNKGFTTHGRSAIPGKKVPERSFVFLDDSEVDAAEAEITEFLFGEGASA